MGIMFYKLRSIQSLILDMQRIDFSLCFIGFSDKSPNFLSLRYYKIIKLLKKITKINNVQFVFCFLVKYQNITKLNAVHILNGKINDIFGESFSKKKSNVICNNKKIAVYFYFDIFSSKTRFISKKVDLVVGLDNVCCQELTDFTKTKFNNKLILIGLNLDLIDLKNKIENRQNICKYFLQI